MTENQRERMRTLRLTALITGTLVLFGACSDSTGPDRTVTELACGDPSGAFISCNLELTEAGGFEILLESVDCRVSGNTLRITQPVSQILTANGCETQPGTIWRFEGPFDAGTSIAMEVESAVQHSPPGLRVEGEYPEWTVYFEDGEDTDFDDMILTVRPLS